MTTTLRRYVRALVRELAQASETEKEEKELLVEPDFDSGRDPELDVEDVEEASVAAGVAGYTLPLGMSGPGYNREKNIAVTRRGFGDAKVSKPKKKKRGDSR